MTIKCNIHIEKLGTVYIISDEIKAIKIYVNKKIQNE